MKGDWWELYLRGKERPNYRYMGFARFELQAPPFKPEAIERDQVRFFLRKRLPWEYDLPGAGAGQVFSGPVEFGEWFARARCGVSGQAQNYLRTGDEVWYMEVTDEKVVVVVEVFIAGNCYDAHELVI